MSTIPDWGMSGALPPFTGADATDGALMSPYEATIEEVGTRFIRSPNRKLIFEGLLKYRRALRSLGIVRGFQWLDGSFIEDVERTESRAPKDVDLVTFAHIPIDPRDTARKLALRRDNPTLFKRQAAKDTFFCDAFFVDLDLPGVKIVERTRYWFGLFSHRRSTYLWKGIVAVDLSGDDGDAWSLVI